MADAHDRHHLRHVPQPHPGHVRPGEGRGTRLVLWVNGRQLVDKLDDDGPLGPGGDIGVFGHNAGKGPSRWTFDYLSVWKV
jgi:hypothetical protein